MESRARSIVKAVSYRVLGSLGTATVFVLLTGDYKLAAGAGLLDSVLKIGLYFLHERIWQHIRFGKRPPPEYEI